LGLNDLAAKKDHSLITV